MPILLDNIDEAAKFSTAVEATKARTIKVVTPKYFSSHLTGRGKKQGLLNSFVIPGRYPMGLGRNTMGTTDLRYKMSQTSNAVTSRIIPIGTIVKRAYEQGYGRMTVPVPDGSDDFSVRLTNDTDTFDVWASCSVQGLAMREDNSGKAKVKDLQISYRTMIYVVPPKQAEDIDDLNDQMLTRLVNDLDAIDPDDPDFIEVDDDDIVLFDDGANDTLILTEDESYRERATLLSTTVNSFPHRLAKISATNQAWAVVDWSYAPAEDAEHLPWDEIFRATGINHSRKRAFLNTLATFFADYSVYDNITDSAQRWSSDDIADDIHDVIDALVSKKYAYYDEQLAQMVYELRYMEQYNVPLSAYRKIYESINMLCDPQTASLLVKQNMNLLMNDTLSDLGSKRDQLERAPEAIKTIPVQRQLSPQQLAAVQSTEPLILTQAGAGAGKSTVILARIQQLGLCGVNPADITVLSFTNAAADNIIKKNPNVRSMTIARMIHDLYMSYFPTHELSSVATIANSLGIYMPKDPFAFQFANRLRKLEGRNSEGAHTALNNFIESHLEQTVDALNLLKQTSLELEIILAYQMIDKMPLPAGLNIRHLIIDEVQDNSIFEFIYLLRLVNKLGCSLFIVGDCSQTLYEFRSANPKALNALESSGVFTPYKLETNYRSNQEVLNMANVHLLSEIEANQFAQIRLQANSLTPVTSDSFQEKVRVVHEHYTADRKFLTDLPMLLSKHVNSYIQECLGRGEQVAFLAFTRREAFAIQKRLEELFPGRSVISMISDRRRASTFFSSFIEHHWSDIEAVDPANASFVFTKELVSRGPGNNPNAQAALAKMASEWWTASALTIQGWVYEYQAGIITKGVFFDRLKKCILDHEIRHNSIRDALIHRNNEERKIRNMETKADLIVSTVHGVKGLEFDNVVVIYKDQSDMAEEKKRLYYVAFTRAKNSLFILSHGTTLSARIVSDYNLIVDSLTNPASGNDVDDDGENHAVDAIVIEEDDVLDAIEGAIPDQNTTVQAVPSMTPVPSAPVNVNTTSVVTPDIIASVINSLNSEADATTSDE
jgi:DNA helicase-2/ATP-dependent DNA helicase PcrA